MHIASTPDADAPGRPRTPEPVDDGRGDRMIRLSWAGTAAFALLAGLALAAVGTFQMPFVVLSGLLFLVGLAAFFAAYAVAVGRSRTDAIGMGGLYFLVGSAPRRVRRHLLASFTVEIVVATVAAPLGFAVVPADDNNALAFGFLVPLFGLGVAGLWGARFGTFPPRAVPAARGHRRPGAG